MEPSLSIVTELLIRTLVQQKPTDANTRSKIITAHKTTHRTAAGLKKEREGEREKRDEGGDSKINSYMTH